MDRLRIPREYRTILSFRQDRKSLAGFSGFTYLSAHLIKHFIYLSPTVFRDRTYLSATKGILGCLFCYRF